MFCINFSLKESTEEWKEEQKKTHEKNSSSLIIMIIKSLCKNLDQKDYIKV